MLKRRHVIPNAMRELDNREPVNLQNNGMDLSLRSR